MKRRYMSTRTIEPPTTRQFFLMTIVLGVLSFIPVFGFFAAIGLVMMLLYLIFADTRGFLSVVWRTLLVVVLLYSCALIIENLHTQEELRSIGVQARDDTQFRLGCGIASALSAGGLVRSILKARERRGQEHWV
jgi:hypothetical protein